jgi:hypothetical protein
MTTPNRTDVARAKAAFHALMLRLRKTDWPAMNDLGWMLHVDRRGCLAYVSPDHTRFQQVS